MVTKEDIADLMDRNEVRYSFQNWVDGEPSRVCSLLVGGVLITFTVDNSSVGLIGYTGRCYPQLTWQDWFRFDETDIEYRGIDLTWWCNHKPALQELVALIESKAEAGPVNCRPDVCT